MFLSFQQVLHRAAKHSGNLIQTLRACLVDVLLPLFVQLDGAQADAGFFRQHGLRTAVGRADALQVGFRKVLPDAGIRNLGKFADVRFVQGIIAYSLLILYSECAILLLQKRGEKMPTISMFRGIKICIYWKDHMPPHFHAFYGSAEVLVSIEELEVLEGMMPSKQLKMLLGWAAFHQEELRENWELARAQQELFAIEPLR